MIKRISTAILTVALVTGLVAMSPPVRSADAAPPPPPAWEWQNPQPNGCTFEALDLITTETGWGVGRGGMIMKTGDGGHTWAGQDSGITNDLNDVQFVDENSGWAVGEANTILYTTSGGEFWDPQTAPGSVKNLYAICMVSDTKGWIVGGGGRILRTVDGGANWTVDTDTGTANFIDCDFTDASHGWAVGADGKVYTTNGGGVWAPQTTGISDELQCVDFVTPQQGWAMGPSGRLIKTTNGGASWTASTVSVDGRNQFVFRDVKFTDALTGWASAAMWGQGYVLRTVDGGATWTKSVWAGGNELYALDVMDSAHGVAAGDGGAVWGTDDGTTWNLTRTSAPGTALTASLLYDVWFSDDLNGWATGDGGTIVRTTDGGRTWSLQVLDSAFFLHHLAFTSATIGWVVGQTNEVYRTTDGNTWTSQNANTTQNLYGAWAAPGGSATDATVWAVGHNGTIRKTTDGGTTWVAHTSGTTVRLYDVTYDNGADIAWIVGDSATFGGMGTVLKGTGSGDTWTPVTTPQTGTIYGVATVAGPPPGKVWTFGAAGIYYSGDGGATWSQQFGLTAVTDIAMYGTDGVAVTSNGAVYRTSDGGANWTADFAGAATLWGASMTSATKAWAVGDGGHILASADAAPLVGTFSLNEGAAFAGAGWTPITGALRLCSSVPHATNMSYRWRRDGGTWSAPQAMTYTPTYGLGIDNAPGVFEFEVTYTDGVHTPLMLTDSITMDMTDPAAPSVTAVPLSTTSVRVSWSGATDAGGAGLAGYRVYLGDTPLANLTSAASQYEITGLSPGTAYTVKVKAIDGGGRYSAYGTAQATTISSKHVVPVYRFYNKRTGAHFYTDSEEERANVIATWPTIFDFEGPAYYIDTLGNASPLYRCYNKMNGSHFYTASYEEARSAEVKWPKVYQYEGPTYSVSTAPGPGRAPIYRFYNKVSGSHFYTASAEEADHVRATWPNVFDYEGPAFWIAQ